MEQIVCNFCGSNSHRLLYSSTDRSFHPKEKFNLVSCNRCGLVFVNPRPQVSEIGSYYPKEYFCCYEEIKKESAEIQLRKIIVVDKYKKVGRILDVGCGRGDFLHQMDKRGWECWGIEISPDACLYARDTLGLKQVINQDLLVSNLPEKSFDVITLWHVLEHVYQPLETLEKIHSLLKDDGVLIINCPNFDGALRRIFRENWYQLDIPRHLYQYRRKVLTRMMESKGFRVKKVEYLAFPLHGLIWFKISLLRAFGAKKPIENIADLRHTDNGLHRSLFWRIGRSVFNSFCWVISYILGLLHCGDDMCISAEKTKK